jgi:hypothetical protein
MSKARGAVLVLAALGLAGIGVGALVCRGPAAGQAVAAQPPGVRAAEAAALPPAPKAEGRGKLAGEGAPTAPGGEVERKLRLAFGDECKEVLWAGIRMEFRSLQLVVAAGSCEFQPDGRVKFSPCWLARFGGGAAAAPTTVCCDAAYFTCDRPVTALADLCRRTILSVEPRGNVRIGFGPPPTAEAVAERQLYSRLREHGRLELSEGRVSLTVGGVEGKKLVRPVLKKLNAEGEVKFVTTAREGELGVNTAKRALLIRLRSGVAEGQDGSLADFEDKVFELPLPNYADGR